MSVFIGFVWLHKYQYVASGLHNGGVTRISKTYLNGRFDAPNWPHEVQPRYYSLSSVNACEGLTSVAVLLAILESQFQICGRKWAIFIGFSIILFSSSKQIPGQYLSLEHLL